MNIFNKIVLSFLLMLLPINAYANGGLPIIFVINMYSFIVGTIFVLLIETKYLRNLFPDISLKELVFCVIIFNFWSGLFTAIVIPILLFVVKLDPLIYALSSDTKESTMTFVWWSSISIDLILAYVATVYIEYKVFKKATFATKAGNDSDVLNHVIKFNLISYLFLIFLIILTILVIN